MSDHESTSPSAPEFWDKLYRSGDTGWDLGSPTPVFEDLIDRKLIPPSGRVLVAGAGKGHDAILFARRGYTVVAVDFARTSIDIAQRNARKAGVALEFLQVDLFGLEQQYRSSFDFMVEYTVFCAIDPSRRGEFSQVTAQVLKPGGLLVGLFFPTDGRAGGPPYAVGVSEIGELFSASFNLVHQEVPQHSVSPRKGKEILMIGQKKEQ